MQEAPPGVPSRAPAQARAEEALHAQRRAEAVHVNVPVAVPAHRPAPNSTTTVMRIPGSVAVAAQGFHPSSFSAEEEEAGLKAAGKVLGGATSMVRWRWADEAKTQRETNTKMVQWSDGSITLHIGKDAFSVLPTPVGGGAEQLYAGVTSKPVQGVGKAETVLEGVTAISHRLTVRPFAVGGVTSNAVLAARQGSRRRGIQIMHDVRDGDKAKAALIEKTERELREVQAAARRTAELNARATRGGRVGDIDDALLEGDEGLMFDDDEGVNVRQLRQAVKAGDMGDTLFEQESEEESEAEVDLSKPALQGDAGTQATQATQPSSDDDDDLFGDEEDSEADADSGREGGGGDAAPPAPSPAPEAAGGSPVGGTKRVLASQATIASSDEEEDAVVAPAKRRRGGDTVLDDDSDE